MNEINRRPSFHHRDSSSFRMILQTERNLHLFISLVGRSDTILLSQHHLPPFPFESIVQQVSSQLDEYHLGDFLGVGIEKETQQLFELVELGG